MPMQLGNFREPDKYGDQTHKGYKFSEEIAKLIAKEEEEELAKKKKVK